MPYMRHLVYVISKVLDDQLSRRTAGPAKAFASYSRIVSTRHKVPIDAGPLALPDMHCIRIML